MWELQGLEKEITDHIVLKVVVAVVIEGIKHGRESEEDEKCENDKHHHLGKEKLNYDWDVVNKILVKLLI